MNPSERIAAINQYIRINAPTDAEICELLDIVTDELRSSEARQNRKNSKIKQAAKDISKYLAIQAG